MNRSNALLAAIAVAFGVGSAPAPAAASTVTHPVGAICAVGVYVTNLNVGRNPQDTLRVLDALQTDELCPCNRSVGGETLKAA